MTTVKGDVIGRAVSITESVPYAEMSIETTDGSFMIPMGIEELEMMRDVITGYLQIVKGEVPDETELLLKRYDTIDVDHIRDYWRMSTEHAQKE